MNTQKLAILAALGIGAYFLFTRTAAAGTLPGKAKPVAKPVSNIWPTTPSTQPAAGTDYMSLGSSIASLWQKVTNPAITRPVGYVPDYTPGTAGEAAAAQYYVDNKDTFAVNPPSSYTFNDGTTSGTGGYLDSL